MLVKPLVRPIVRAIAGNPTASLGSGFSPKSLFVGGAAGAYWDTSVVSSLWKDVSGTIPVTTAGDLVARIDDLSGNGRHLTQAVSGSMGTYQIDSYGRGYVLLDGANDYYEVSTSTTLFKFLHDGTGCMALTSFSLSTPLTASKIYPLFATSLGSGASRGATAYAFEAAATDITSQQQLVGISNGTAMVINGTSGGQGSVRGDGVGQVLGYTYVTQAGSDYFAWCDGNNFNLGRAESAVPSTGDSALSLRVGNGHGSAYLAGGFRGAVLLGRYPTNAERISTVRYLQGLYSDSGFFICVGDSHTYNTAYGFFMREYYPALLEAKMRTSGYRPASLNYGVSGNTTANIISRMSSVLENGSPIFAIVYAGQNDSAIDTEANLESIVSQIKAAGCGRVLVCGSHYMNFASGGDTTSTQNATYEALRLKQSAAATDSGAIYVDLYEYMRQLIIAGTYTQGNDTAWHVGVGNTHLNEVGQSIVADAIYETMQEQGWA